MRLRKAASRAAAAIATAALAFGALFVGETQAHAGDNPMLCNLEVELTSGANDLRGDSQVRFVLMGPGDRGGSVRLYLENGRGQWQPGGIASRATKVYRVRTWVPTRYLSNGNTLDVTCVNQHWVTGFLIQYRTAAGATEDVWDLNKIVIRDEVTRDEVFVQKSGYPMLHTFSQGRNGSSTPSLSWPAPVDGPIWGEWRHWCPKAWNDSGAAAVEPGWGFSCTDPRPATIELGIPF